MECSCQAAGPRERTRADAPGADGADPRARRRSAWHPPACRPHGHARPETARRCFGLGQSQLERVDPGRPDQLQTAGALEVDRAAMGAAASDLHPAEQAHRQPAVLHHVARHRGQKASLLRGHPRGAGSPATHRARERPNRSAQIEVHPRGQDVLRGRPSVIPFVEVGLPRGPAAAGTSGDWRPWRRRDRAENRPRSERRSPRRPARRSGAATGASSSVGSAYTRPLS